MVGFYSHEAMKYCYITIDGILYIQLVIGFIACRMPSHFMYLVRNGEIKMFNQSINQSFTGHKEIENHSFLIWSRISKLQGVTLLHHRGIGSETSF